MKDKIVKNKRRNFLKFLAVGGGAFLLGRALSSLPNSLVEKTTNTADFKNFKFVETNKKLTLYDRSGEEIIIVEKDGI